MRLLSNPSACVHVCVDIRACMRALMGVCERACVHACVRMCMCMPSSACHQISCPSGVGCLDGPDKLCTGINYCNDTSDNDPDVCNESFNCTATGRVGFSAMHAH